MDKIWSFFIRSNRFSFLLMFSLLLFGLYSVNQVPKESSPEVTIPYGIVITTMPGASATEIEALITNEIERGLSGTIDGVKKITSTSSEGASQVIVEYNTSVNIDEAIADLKSAMDTIATRLPNDANTPTVSDFNLNEQPVMQIAFSSDRSAMELSELAKSIEREFESVNGVSKVEISGVRSRAVNITINPETLTRYNITLSDVTSALSAANNTFPIGSIINNDTIYNVTFRGDIKDTGEIADLPIVNLGGSNVYLRDIAVVEDGLAPETSISRLSLNNQPSESALTVSVYKTAGFDITRLASEVNKKIAELKEPGELLHGVESHIMQDMGAMITKDLINLGTSGLITVVLVVGVLMIAIGWREGLVAGIAVPLSFTISFIGMYLFGNTINFLSLFALILGIGILVDSGIVIVEGINRRMKENPDIDKTEAARITVRDFASPVTAGTLTTVGMFSGLFVVGGIIGDFISSIPFTLIFVLLASLLVTLGFLPLVATLVLKRQNRTKMERLQLEYSHQAEEWYRERLVKIIDSSFNQRWFLRGIFAALFISIALIPLGLVKVVFFDEEDASEMTISIELPEGSVKERTDIVARQVEDVLYDYPDMVEAFSTTVGPTEKSASIFVTLKDDRKMSSLQFANEIDRETSQLAGANINFTQTSSGPPSGAGISLNLFGDDLDQLRTATDLVTDAIRNVEGVTNIDSSNKNNSNEFVFTLDKDRTIASGLTPQTVSMMLRTAVYGSEATSITTLDESIPVMVRLNLTGQSETDAGSTNHANISALENIMIGTPAGNNIPLSSLVNTSLREANTSIAHEDQRRIMNVTADVASGYNLREVNAEVRSYIDNNDVLPEGVTLSFAGEQAEMDEAFADLFLALILGIVLMLAMLVLELNSFRHTYYVLSVIPFSLIGVLLGLALTGNSLSFPAIMGFIALTGIVVNNSILLIDSMNNMRREDPERPIRDVVIAASVFRLRPILLTTVTTVMGLIPLLFSDPIWAPLAYAVMFGLMFAVVITLVLIPVLYLRKPGVVS